MVKQEEIDKYDIFIAISVLVIIFSLTIYCLVKFTFPNNHKCMIGEKLDCPCSTISNSSKFEIVFFDGGKCNCCYDNVILNQYGFYENVKECKGLKSIWVEDRFCKLT